METIILTGYNDFSYAKAALENGVSAYLLKPVNISELEKTMKNIRDKIENKQHTKKAVHAYITNLQEQMIMNMINKQTPYVEICKSYDKRFLFPCGNYFIAIVSIDNKYKIKDSINKVSLVLKETIEYAISVSEHYIVKCMIDCTKYLLAIFLNDSSSYESSISTLNQIRTNFNDVSGHTVTIGISGIFRNLNMISKAYTQSEIALEQKVLLGNNIIIDYTKINFNDKAEVVLTSQDIDDITEAIKRRDSEKAKNIINNYFILVKNSPGVSISSVKDSIIKLAIMIIKITVSNADMMNLVFGRIVQPTIELQSVEFLSDIQDWILNMINCTNNLSRLYPDVRNPMVQKTIDYVISKYDQPLTLEWIAKQLFVSVRHLSRCFKQECGMTFNEYLTKYRMEKAALLFKSGKYKIYEIANLVGYQDPKYFCKLFRKTMGKNLKDYKNIEEI